MSFAAEHDQENDAVVEDDEIVEAGAVEGEEAEAEDDKPQSVEDIARSLGWKPQKEWKGQPPPNGFATAAEYIARQVSGAERNRKEVKDLRKQVSGMHSMHVEALSRQRAQIEARYKTERANIVKEGGDKAAENLEALDQARDKALGSLPKPEPIDETIEAAEIAETIAQSPLASRFFNDNPWLMEDEDEEAVEMFNWAGQAFDEMLANKWPRAAAYRKIEAHLKEMFPERYQAPAKEAMNGAGKEAGREAVQEEEKPAPVKDPATGRFVRAPVMAQPGRGGGRQSWASKLSAEELKIAKEDVKEGLFADVEEYARTLARNRGEKVDG